MSVQSDPSPFKEQSNASDIPVKTQSSNTLRQLISNLLVPLKVRDFRLLFSGQMISTIGDMFYAVALPWLMLSSGRTPQELGIVLAAYGIPRVGTLLLGGLLSDWLRPRNVMLLSDIMRALFVSILVLQIVTGYTEVWQLCIVAAHNLSNQCCHDVRSFYFWLATTRNQGIIEIRQVSAMLDYTPAISPS